MSMAGELGCIEPLQPVLLLAGRLVFVSLEKLAKFVKINSVIIKPNFYGKHSAKSQRNRRK